MDLKELPIGTFFKFNDNVDIFKLIGYNHDRTKIFYISIDDKIIYGNLKECSVEKIGNIC